MKIEEILENEIVVSFDYIGEYDELINHYVLFDDKKKAIAAVDELKESRILEQLYLVKFVNWLFTNRLLTKTDLKSRM